MKTAMTNSLKPVPRWVRGLGQVALWFGAILGLLSIVLAVATFAFGVQPLVFRSGSMSPEIKAGALAFAKEMPASQVLVGDVVSVVDTDGRRVTHRVTATTKPDGVSGAVELTLKGDANKDADADPYIVNTVDKVVFDLPYAGYVASWLSGPIGMFLAGLIVAVVLISLFLRPGGGRSPGKRVATSHGLSLLIAMGLLAPVGLAQGAATGTDAYFTDNARFEAGVVGAHRVLVFDWGTPNCRGIDPVALLPGFYRKVRLNWKIRDIRYETVWTSSALSGGMKADPQTGSVNADVFTEFAPADFGSGSAAAVLTGRSRLRNTPDWISTATRVQTVDRTSLLSLGVLIKGLRCAGEEVPPDVFITRPVGGQTSRSGVQESINTDCGASPVKAACGTAQPSGTKTITTIEYELRQSSGFTGTRCWNPASASYTRATCGTWNMAAWTPGSGERTWSVLGNAYGDFLLVYGEYTLTVRVTDSSGQVQTKIVEFRVYN